MEENPNLEKFEEETAKWVEGRKNKRWTVSRELRKNYILILFCALVIDLLIWIHFERTFMF